jgi:hypothetical protein
MIYIHRKYCEICEKYFYYTLTDSISESNTCPENVGHTTSNCRVILIT